jgi:hypothetical protein
VLCLLLIFLGAASGLPLERPVSTLAKVDVIANWDKINTTILDTSLSGVGQLKSVVSAFQDTVKNSLVITRTPEWLLLPSQLQTKPVEAIINTASQAGF